jgi:hypothetical protein
MGRETKEPTMTDDELNEWLDGYLTRNPEQRAVVVDALAATSSPESRREVIERLQEDKAAQTGEKPSDVGL